MSHAKKKKKNSRFGNVKRDGFYPVGRGVGEGRQKLGHLIVFKYMKRFH